MAELEIKDGVAIIPEGTTKIDDNAFCGCADLSQVVIPNSVKKIGEGAFVSCTNLKSVTMPAKVLKIGVGAFAGCTSLTNITIPTPLKSKGEYKIAERAFEDCCSLTSITIPNKVTIIECCAFAGCIGLTEVNLPASVTEIGDGAFYGCTSLVTINIPASVRKIGRCVFNGCTSLSNIAIPSSVTEIGRYAFNGCTNNNIPSSVKIESAPTYTHPYTNSIDVRLKQDLDDLYNNGKGIGEMQGAKVLDGIIATQPGQTSFATKGIPSYGGGKRGAKTVMVMLNPGEDVTKTNANLKRDLCKRGMKDLQDIYSYNEFNAHYGHWDRKRPDPFDLKQAFFLRDWGNTGIDLPIGLCANSSPEEKLVAKERVLDDKQQLELIPYASRKFDSFVSTQEVFPYIDLLLEEIFSADRKYVIFCANIFEEVFKAYNGYNQTNGKVAFVDVSKRGKPISRKVEISYTNKDGQPSQMSCYCTVIELAYGGKSTRAIIANTFPKQNLTNAYEVMAAYGKFCYECLQGKHQNSVCKIKLP